MRALVLSPSYPAETIGFTRGLAEVGVGVWGVGDTPRDDLPASVKPYLVDYLYVPRILDEVDVMNRIADWLRGRSIDRVLANWEPVVMLAARLRERSRVKTQPAGRARSPCRKGRRREAV